MSALIIGLASVAPAYSLAAVMGLLGGEAGLQTPAILIVSFVPMLLIATAYQYMNRADPDCGTTFAWASKALGPTSGWFAGWAIMVAGIIVIGLLAQTAAVYFYFLIGADGAAADKTVVTLTAIAVIIAMTYISLIGIEISARFQVILITLQVLAMVFFAVVVLFKVFDGSATPESVEPAASWFSPFALDGGTSALTAGILIGVFVYWGWDSAVTVNEESEDSTEGPGRAAVVSTVILLGIYLLFSTAIVAWLGVDKLTGFEDETVVNAVAEAAFSSPFDKIIILAVMVSALSATQTTVLPASRTSLSMGRKGAAPRTFATIHPRYLTPTWSTIGVGALSVAFYAIFNTLAESFYAAALGALGILICVNYGMNGLACVVFYRRELSKSARNLFFIGVLPTIGTLVFAYVLGRSVYDFTKGGLEDTDYWLGWQSPLVLCIGLFVLGIGLLIWWRLSSSYARGFFSRKPQTYDGDAPATAAATAPAGS